MRETEHVLDLIDSTSLQISSEKRLRSMKSKDKVTLDQGVDQCIEWVQRNFDALKDQSFDYIHKR